MIDLLRGRAGAIKRNEALARPALVSPITIEEVWRGAKSAEHAAIDGLFRSLRVVHLDAIAAERSGRWRGEFAARGITVGQADCLIAAAAVGAGARLATGNPRDFPMEGLEVEHWPVGS